MMDALKGRMPDITQSQVLAAIVWVVSQAVAVGWINNDQAQHWVQLGSTILASVWIIADTLLRGFRNMNEAKKK
jgi:hypothetical protein